MCPQCRLVRAAPVHSTPSVHHSLLLRTVSHAPSLCHQSPAVTQASQLTCGRLRLTHDPPPTPWPVAPVRHPPRALTWWMPDGEPAARKATRSAPRPTHRATSTSTCPLVAVRSLPPNAHSAPAMPTLWPPLERGLARPTAYAVTVCMASRCQPSADAVAPCTYTHHSDTPPRDLLGAVPATCHTCSVWKS